MLTPSGIHATKDPEALCPFPVLDLSKRGISTLDKRSHTALVGLYNLTLSSLGDMIKVGSDSIQGDLQLERYSQYEMAHRDTSAYGLCYSRFYNVRDDIETMEDTASLRYHRKVSLHRQPATREIDATPSYSIDVQDRVVVSCT